MPDAFSYDLRSGGFSLVEVIVVIAVLSLLVGALAPLTIQQIDAGRRAATRQRLEALQRGLVGEPGSGDYGYVGDMGGLPAALTDLNQRGSQPGYVVDTSDGIGAGWNGPYAPGTATAGTAPVDSWGTPIQYSSALAQVISAGPDRSVGTADDLAEPFTPAVTSGNVIVSVRGFVGGTEVPMSPSTVQVTVSSSVGGVRQDQATSGSNPFTRNNVHIGYHGIVATGQGSDFGGIVARDVVDVRRGNTLVTLVMAAP